MITVNIENLECLTKLSDRLETANILGIIGDELEIFANVLRNDPEIPKEYSDAIFISTVKSMDTVGIALDFTNEYKYAKFGNKLEYAVYTCPRRKYPYGKITPAYGGPNYLKEKWENYKPIFMGKVRDSIVQAIKG
jgi:hypothetical protein